TLTPITSFDSANPQGGRVTCGGPDVTCGFYFNYDTVHSQARADKGLLQGTDCQLEIEPGALVVSPGVGANLVSEPTTRCDVDQGAFHFVAQNLAMCKGTDGRRGWGGGQEIDFQAPGGAAMPIDASAYDGFSFWVKNDRAASHGAEEIPSERSIIVLAVDLYTAGQRNIVNPVTGEARNCDAGDPPIQPRPDYDNDKCDPYAVGVTLEDEWTFVAVRFADMRQKGFGMYSPEGLQTQELLRLQFLITAGDWDFWIDDVSFFQDAE
ncbi:MAG TPA: hypothetical protein VGK73_23265, partial [Polyangiaceae bacterium]